MAWRLLKKEEERKTELRQELEKQYGALEDEARTANEKIAAIVAALNVKVAAYNEKLEEARGFIADIASEKRDEYDNKSYNWQESERGQSALSWIESLEEFANASDLTEAVVADIEPMNLGDDASEALDEVAEAADDV